MQVVLDHIVLNVLDVELELSFYCGVVGLAPERVEEYRAGTVLFPSVRLNADTLIDLAPPEMWGGGKGGLDGMVQKRGPANLDHFCLCVDKSEWSGLERRLQAAETVLEAGPLTLWGAHGDATAYYYKDPEENRVEFRYYEASKIGSVGSFP